MPQPAPDPRKVARAYELWAHEGASLRFIAEDIGVAPNTAKRYIEEGREAVQFLEAQELGRQRERVSDFLMALTHKGMERLADPDSVYEDVVPAVLKVVAEFNKVNGLYAAQRVRVEGDGPTGPRPEVAAAIADAVARSARERQEIERGQ